MTPTTIGIRDLKARLSNYILEARAGNVVVITERGRPVARLVPIRATVEQRLEELIEAGLLEWNGQRMTPSMPEIEARGEATVAELLLEDRE